MFLFYYFHSHLHYFYLFFKSPYPYSCKWYNCWSWSLKMNKTVMNIAEEMSLWYPALIHGGRIGYREFFQFSCSCWDLLCDQVCDQFWRLFCEVLRRRYILLCLGEIAYKFLIGPFDSYYLQFFLCFNFVWIDSSLVRVGH